MCLFLWYVVWMLVGVSVLNAHKFFLVAAFAPMAVVIVALFHGAGDQANTETSHRHDGDE